MTPGGEEGNVPVESCSMRWYLHAAVSKDSNKYLLKDHSPRRGQMCTGPEERGFKIHRKLLSKCLAKGNGSSSLSQDTCKPALPPSHPTARSF